MKKFLHALAYIDELQLAASSFCGDPDADERTEAGTVHVGHFRQIQNDGLFSGSTLRTVLCRDDVEEVILPAQRKTVSVCVFSVSICNSGVETTGFAPMAEDLLERECPKATWGRLGFAGPATELAPIISISIPQST